MSETTQLVGVDPMAPFADGDQQERNKRIKNEIDVGVSRSFPCMFFVSFSADCRLLAAFYAPHVC